MQKLMILQSSLGKFKVHLLIIGQFVCGFFIIQVCLSGYSEGWIDNTLFPEYKGILELDNSY